MIIQYAVMSEKGARFDNQDNFCVEGIYRKLHQLNFFCSGISFRKYQSFFVLDGMGGEQAGRQASFFAALFLADQCNRIKTADIYTRILEASHVVSKLSKNMECSAGTTLAGLVIEGNKITAVNVGDTRIYQLHKGELIQISMDHTLYQFKKSSGMIYEEKADRNILTQYLGVDPEEYEISPFLVHEIPYKRGDIFLICSDGISGILSEEQIGEILVTSRNAKDCCAALIQNAISKNGKDNMTVVVVCMK